MSEIYDEIKGRFNEILKDRDMLAESVRVKARALSAEEAIGNPEADDFPLQKGRERLMQAEFRGAFGQAFTDRYGDFEGTLGEILEMPLENNYRRAVFIATLNAVLRSLGMIEKTVHCRDREPARCARELVESLKAGYGKVNILQVGFQPRMVEYLAREFRLKVLDLDEENIGAEKFGVVIEGPEATVEAVEWADLLLVTGTTVVNDTIHEFLGKKPMLLYGTTISGAARLMGWERFCAYGH
ncbi:MAG: hypothetical protein JRH13_03435 [Deltaproteobacteria bacterium]|nr:hypothetical protein [Deltaproteobacteria bacterium]MBW2017613.1 hypothetical protein [Deltaproteobacteria bacterium]MBW2128400.1 hypothetical protein [Deltaproteobacteria bacterium]MBW2304366.1 hypothetical protein [Deltaproteobacteria bacterium]